MKPWTLTDQEIVNVLSTSPQSGLTKAEALRRIQYFGPNVLAADKRLPRWIRFFAQFRSPVVTTLLIATVISTLVGEFIDAAAILVIVVINAIIGYIQEAISEWSFDGVRKRMSVGVETAGNVVIHVKGAPESVLPLCIDL